MAYESSSFSRIKENEAKMGAYYTDVAHCNDIRKMFLFPDEEVCVLEPSIGDASAVISVTGAASNQNIKIFGVELNDEVAEQTAKNPYVTECLKADFTNGVAVQKNSFSFAFGNPPYLTERNDAGDRNVRLERVFLDKIVNYLKIGAVLVWVIPYSAFCEMSYLRMWMRDFDTEAIYRFRESEYQKYHQIVVVGRKVRRRTPLMSELSAFSTKWNLSNLPVLPSDLTPTIEVYPSYEKEIGIFTTRLFDEQVAYSFLSKGIPNDIKVAFDRRVAQKSYSGGKLSRPPIALKKDSKYLLVTSGFSDGMVGSTEEKDLHLLRGVSEVIEESRYNTGEDEYGDESSGTVTVTTRTSVSLRILENDGKITVLE